MMKWILIKNVELINLLKKHGTVEQDIKINSYTSDNFNQILSDVYFADVSPIMQIHTHMFSLYCRSIKEVWDIKGRLAGY